MDLFEHPNVELVRGLFDAFAFGNTMRIYSVLGENAVWHFPGRHSQLAGDHQGREAIFAFLAKIPLLSHGSFRVELIDVFAKDDHAIAIYTTIGHRNGIDLHHSNCLRMQIENGKILEFWEYVWDQDVVEQFWA